MRWRREHQPGGQNCGSVFVNPVPGEVSAGSLVDGLGLRGLRIGTAWVSEKHANFVQAAEGGSAADVRAVIEAVRARVAEATGFRLRSEVRLVGFGEGRAVTRADQPGRPPLPGADVPSAEVLDELLRAFSVDVTDQAAAGAASTSPARRSPSCSRRRGATPRGSSTAVEPSASNLRLDARA